MNGVGRPARSFPGKGFGALVSEGMERVGRLRLNSEVG